MKKQLLSIMACGALLVGFVACNSDKTATESDSSQEATEEVADASQEQAAPQVEAVEGFTLLPSGLQYKVIKEGGEGVSPKIDDTVTVKYTGKLADGTVFDSTDNHNGEPATFPLKGLIKGWQEGLQLMTPGAVYEFIIPSDLAYGKQGYPGAIPPDATLTFDVELISVN